MLNKNVLRSDIFLSIIFLHILFHLSKPDPGSGLVVEFNSSINISEKILNKRATCGSKTEFDAGT